MTATPRCSDVGIPESSALENDILSLGSASRVQRGATQASPINALTTTIDRPISLNSSSSARLSLSAQHRDSHYSIPVPTPGASIISFNQGTDDDQDDEDDALDTPILVEISAEAPSPGQNFSHDAPEPLQSPEPESIPSAMIHDSEPDVPTDISPEFSDALANSPALVINALNNITLSDDSIPPRRNNGRGKAAQRGSKAKTIKTKEPVTLRRSSRK